MIGIPEPVRVLMDDEPLLRTVSEPVAEAHFGGELDRLLAVMTAVAEMRSARGLAAIQIGVPVRVLIVSVGGAHQEFVNPTVTRTLNRFTVDREGCLSIPPYKWGDVSRPAKCDATWFDANGEQHSATLTGDLARVFQHEFDHLNGVLMTDRRA